VLHASRRLLAGCLRVSELLTRNACVDFDFSEEMQEIRSVFHRLLLAKLIFRAKYFLRARRKSSFRLGYAKQDFGTVVLEKRRLVKFSPVTRHRTVCASFHVCLQLNCKAKSHISSIPQICEYRESCIRSSVGLVGSYHTKDMAAFSVSG
jgi:hypothetical protein